METVLTHSSDKAVSRWLMAGVVMIMIQVVLGGITRLTESGLSITEWNPITGMLPPLNEAQWQQEFDKYKNTDQFRYIHADFTLSDFKYIFFWEWFHRVWARLLGIVFLAGFVYFLVTRKFRRDMVIPLIILFLLGAMQGAIGWIMVKSGLVPEKYYVGHVELATHFLSALGLLVYTYWFALRLRVPDSERQDLPRPRAWLIALLVLLVVQLAYGAFMAGLKAATVAPTWPDINGQWMPEGLDRQDIEKPWVNNPFAVQFVHRMLAYLLTFVALGWWWMARSVKGSRYFESARHWVPAVVLVQVLLGILTVVNSPSATALLWLGVLHQFVAMLLLVVVIYNLYLLTARSSKAMARF